MKKKIKISTTVRNALAMILFAYLKEALFANRLEPFRPIAKDTSV